MALGRALILVALLAACSASEPPRPAVAASPTRAATSAAGSIDSRHDSAVLAITLFHVRYDQRNYRGVYAMLDGTTRATTTEAQLTAMLATTRDRLGISGPGDELYSDIVDLQGSPDLVITIVLNSLFERGFATETFVWRVTPDETTYLVRYEVR